MSLEADDISKIMKSVLKAAKKVEPDFEINE